MSIPLEICLAVPKMGGDGGHQMGFADLIFAELQRRNVSLREFSDLAGVDHSTLSKIINDGRRPAPVTIRKLAPLLGQTEDDLLTLVGHRSAKQPPSRPRTADDILIDLQRNLPIAVPKVKQVASAGPGEAEAEEYVYLPPRGGRRPKLFAIAITGRCMEPEICAGDTVIVDLEQAPTPGRIVIATVTEDGVTQTLVKRLIERRGVRYLAPNGGQAIQVDERVNIVGVVVHVGRDL